MPDFTYEAMATSGVRTKGTLTAQSPREVMSMLDARGLYPIRIDEAKANIVARRWGSRVKPRTMAAFYAQLADLLQSGVPLLRSIELLERQSSQPALGEVLREVRARVADGTSLGDAMAQHPRAFSELAVSMVRAGQEGGFLEDVLRRIADFSEQQEDLKSKVMGAMAYPIFLATVGSLVILGLIIFFVPRFENIFKQLDKEGQLPTLTVALIGTSNFLIYWGWALAIALVGLGLLYWNWSKTPKARQFLDAMKLRLPGAGGIALSLALSRFTRILGTLLHNGIPILTSLRIAKDSTGNKVLSDAIEKSAENIKAGDKLATPLAACKHFPRDVVEMIAVGEESNNLDKVLVDIANALEKRTTRHLELFVRLLEPLMLLVMAVGVLLVVLGLLMPIFRMASVVK
jgi:general secretion pathway protein F/type IV pilus assembly protein PilC